MFTTAPTERYLTVKRAAEHLSVTPATLRLWLRQGKVRGQLLGARTGYRIPESEIVRILRGEPLPTG